MEPNLHDSQFVFVGKTYSYLQRGDIVVIKPFNNGRFYIKRIV
jgi:signal peptidase I